jgi:arylsulfatase A-like enzyme
VDEGVEQVVDALDDNGELDDTVIAYTSDNGFLHGEHRIPRGKLRVYEESIRSPLEIRGPGIPQGVSVTDLTTNADLAPTILDVADEEAGLTMDGRSLLPLANRPRIARGRELLIELKIERTFSAIRTERYLYAEYGAGAKELYDLNKDPFQLTSRHADPAYASVRSQLAAHLHQLQNCAGSGCRIHSPP